MFRLIINSLFNLITKFLRKLCQLRLDHKSTIALIWIIVEIILVIILSRIEFRDRCKLCYDGSIEHHFLFQLINHVLSSFLLFLSFIKNYRTILSAGIISLSV